MLCLLLTALLSSPPLGGVKDFESLPDSTDLKGLADSILTDWMEGGHLLARIHLEARGKRTHWSVTPGPTFQWRILATTGDNTYRPATLMRLGHIRRGDLATPSSLDGAIRRIEAAGCTEATAPARWTGMRGTTWADARLPLQEIPCSQADLVMGWEQTKGFQGQGSVTLANLLGTARSASLQASSRSDLDRFSLDWHEPWLGDMDLALDLHASLQQSPSRQLQQGSLQGRWQAPLGAWNLGMEAWSSTTNLTDTTVLHSRAWGTRLGWSWTPPSPSTWLHPARNASVSAATLRTRGTPRPWLVETTFAARWGVPFRHFALALGTDAQALLPLDSLSSAGSLRALGGSNDWKGHREGQFPTAQWILGSLEARIEAGGWGAAAFFLPGAAWIWRANGPQPHLGLGAGIGLNWARGPNQVRLDLAVGEETRDWQDALLHLTLANRF